MPTVWKLVELLSILSARLRWNYLEDRSIIIVPLWYRRQKCILIFDYSFNGCVLLVALGIGKGSQSLCFIEIAEVRAFRLNCTSRLTLERVILEEKLIS